jgi:type VI secretion system protein ImpE
MDTKELIRAGRIGDARRQLIEEVKTKPADTAKRVLLFQVLCLFGEWAKAERHLDLIMSQDRKSETGVQVYKNLLRAELMRSEVGKLGARPSFLPEAPPYTEMYFAALNHLKAGKFQEAADFFAAVDSHRPGISGTVNGKSFSGVNDTDAFLSCFLEAIVHDAYVWIPFESIRELVVSPPATLFDTIWVPARGTLWEGLSLNCYLPVLYPDSFLNDDDRIRLGRMTEWAHLGGPFHKGMGQHVFQFGEEDIAILEIRDAIFNNPEPGKA